MVFDHMKLGATGEFPDGKLDENDEGELQLAVGVDRNLNVRIDFGKPVVWLAMPPEQALELGEMIVKQAHWARDQRPHDAEETEAEWLAMPLWQSDGGGRDATGS